MKDIKCSKTILIVGVIVFIILFLICCYLFIMPNNGNTVIESGKSNQFVSTNALTMMYETEANSGEYQVSSDVSWPQDGYVFNETLSKCENGGTLSWNSETNRIIMQANSSDKCYVYFDIKLTIEDLCSNNSLVDCIITHVYTGVDGENYLYYHDGLGTYTNADQETGDNSYRYSGANPNNYVCFGSDEESCPNDNLYRIIGLFNDTGEYQIKLIKNDYLTLNQLGTGGIDCSLYSYGGSYYRGNNYENIGGCYWSNTLPGRDWNSTPLNTINLNTNFINSFTAIWSSIISDSFWKTPSNESSVLNSIPLNIYNNEFGINNPSEGTIDAKMGMLYMSEYAYAINPIYWSSNLDSNYSNIVNENWMYMGLYEWTLSLNNNTGNASAFLNENGIPDYFMGYIYYQYAIRPTFYLNSDVQYVSGTGTSADPYRISM